MALTFTQGGPTTIEIPVMTRDDDIVEGDEDFAGLLSLSGSMPGIRLGTRTTATGTIEDNDSKAMFLFDWE